MKRKIFTFLLFSAIGAGISMADHSNTVAMQDALTEPSDSVANVSVDSIAKGKSRTTNPVPEIPATFYGGIKGLFKYLGEEINYPQKAVKEKTEGRVRVKFIVDEEGNVTEAAVIEGVSPELDAEALRVVKNMPKWNPAWHEGKRVKYYYVLPVQFRL